MIKKQTVQLPKWRGGVLLLLSLILMGTVFSGGTAASSPRQGGPASATGPSAQEERHPKIDSALAQLTVTGVQSQADSPSLRLSEGRVQVQVITDAANLTSAEAAMTKAGGEVTGVGLNNTVIQGWLPIDELETVAAQNSVHFIRRPLPVFPLERLQVGNSTSEGLEVINGLAWHTAGYTGAGIKVGIIDLGYVGYQGLLGSDLPAKISIKNFVDGESDEQMSSTTEHGTACAEVIYDLAPSAELYLAKVGTDLDIAEAVDWLISQQVDIISTSIGLYNASPGDGTGFLADLVDQARAAGILWVTAAGNDRVSHWGGVYNNTDTDSFHEFVNGEDANCFTLTLFGIPGCSSLFFGQVNIFVRWSDWEQVDQDFDVHLVKWNGTAWETVASSTNVQNGSPGQTPTEWVAASVFDFAPYGFRIERVSGNRPVNFEVFTPGLISFGFGLQEGLIARSVANLADSPGALTVAALNVAAPYDQEFYSSEGPTNGPGGTDIGGFNKPDLSGFANVSTQSYGPGIFNGTSSATPHVAGAAVLVLSANPDFSPGQLQSFLEEQAVDMGETGLDPQFGYGRLHLPDPVTNQQPIHLLYLPTILNTGP